MKRLLIWTTAIAGLAGLTANAEISEEVIQNSFYPYENWTPAAPGYEPGVVINAGNADQYQDILDDFSYRYLKKGWFEMKTGPTFSMPLHKNYVQATRDHAEGVSLSAEGILVNFVLGRPFPQEPDPKDPEAGLKLIWNFQRGFNAGDSETIAPFHWSYRNAKSGRIERVIKVEIHFLNWKHRTVFDPKPDVEPNPGQLFRSQHILILEPFDLANTQLLINRYEDDLKRDDGWLYVGFQRRVRRLATGQNTDAFLGSDLMIEDAEGYNGRISDYNWEYLETKNILTPYIKHNEQELDEVEPKNDPDGYHFVKFGGQGGCFPQITWQLRATDVVRGTPKNPHHPLSQRILYIDRQSSTIPMSHVYDKKGDPWKYFPICKTHTDYHLPQNKGADVVLDDCALFFDEQAMHCTTLQFKSVITRDGKEPRKFTVQELRRRGN